MWILAVVVTLLAALSQIASLPPSTAPQSLKFDTKAWVNFASKFGKNPEIDMNSTELIRSKGYPVERHFVVTEDGYILGLYRIPHGRHNKKNSDPRPVVLLQHGLISISDCFLLNPANDSLGFILADAGADVWLANSRGNAHSRNHTRLDPHSLDFWKFSWDDMAQYDLPATIYYILNQTNHQQLYYVGHSQGTAIGFARFSEDQEVASRVKHFIALAPIGRVGHTISPIRFLVPFASEIKFFLDTFGHGEFNVPEPILKAVAGDLCEKWGDLICENLLFLICGYNPRSFNTSRTDVYVSHAASGTSAMNLLQWAQNVKAVQFQHFDYGEKENIVKYGQKTPPLYDPSKVKVPVAIFRGGNDWLADNRDVAWLLPQLNVTHDIYIPYYEHLDPAFGVDAPTLMYKYLIDIVMGK